jgi:hypothetical protein
MRSILLCAALAALASPAVAQTAADTTIKEVIAKGQTMTGDMQGTELSFVTTFAADGTYKTVLAIADRTMLGTWRVDGDKLCTKGPAGDTGPEDCTVYPAGKKSGDTFDVTHPRLGAAKITIN